ncbi:MAG: FixH family protein [Neisseria sp.]|uniref:FixH family protein n=1 Tax=Neisseria sp. TaxID=192066 RepID=UPI0026DCFA22|nr:FixH family protein [Neisseria sp.]MDO4641071.1 FixH family protein [Neisseria sp.]
MSKSKPVKAWYKEPWPWILMAGPAIVVVAAVSTFFIAKTHNSDLVIDDYYKDGKHINLQLERDQEAKKRNIEAQVLISPTNDVAKVFISGNFDPKQKMSLLFMHPARQDLDQKITLQPGALSGDKKEYNAIFKPLPATEHWYVRVEDDAGKWRVEDKWLVKSGNAVILKPVENLE